MGNIVALIKIVIYRTFINVYENKYVNSSGIEDWEYIDSKQKYRYILFGE